MKIHFKIAGFFLFMLVLTGITGQSYDIKEIQQLDSLNQIIANTSDNLQKSQSLFKVAEVYENSDQLIKAKDAYKTALLVIDVHKQLDLFALTNIRIGEIYQNPQLFKLDSSLYHSIQASLYFDKLSSEIQLESHIRLMNINYALFRFEQAMSSCLNCVELAKEAGDKKSLRYCYNRMSAFSQLYLHDNQKVKEYTDLALALALEDDDPNTWAYYYLSTGSSYSEIGLQNLALSYLDSCEKYIYQGGDKRILSDLYLERGDAHCRLDNPEYAEQNYLRSLYYADSLNLLNRQMHAPINMADLALSQRKYNKAIRYANQALAVAPDKLTLYELDKTNHQLYQAHKGLNNFNLALQYFEKWNIIQDSMNALNNLSIIAGLESKYKSQDQKRQIEFQQKEISNKEKQRNLIFGLSIVLALILAALSFLFLKMKASNKEIKKQNAIITAQSEQLKQLDRMKSRFFANVTHELRTPLTLMLGPISSALKRGKLDNRDHTFLTTAKQNGQDLLKLVSSILDLSKMESGNIELNEKPELLFKLCRRIASTFESYAQRQDIQFSFVYNAENNLQLQLDKEKIEVILNNLLSNAIKFTPKGGKIDIQIDDLANRIQLVVTDTGRGIHPDDLPNIFNRFYQSNQEDALIEGGTGIGLALSMEYAKLMGATLSVQSEVGKGSAFVFSLPRKEILGMVSQEAGEKNESNQKTEWQNGLAVQQNDKPFTVLIVEDNPSLSSYISTILSPYYNIRTAENGQDALDFLSTEMDCQLVISDIMMPIMDGYQLLENIKSDPQKKHLPVIMLTARADAKDKLKALRIGVDDYLLKPFDEDELLARIENLLSNYKNRTVFNENKETQNLEQQNSEEDKLWLQNCENTLSEHLSNSSYQISQLSQELNISESTLSRQLKRITGLTPAKYLQEMRLNKVRRLLETQNDLSVRQLSKMVGYADAKALSKAYKKRFGKLLSKEVDFS